MSQILLVIFIAFSSLFPAIGAASEEGTLHLRKSDLMSRPIALDGNWHFTFLGQKSLMEVPGSWTRKGFPSFGEGIYELNIEFDEDVETLALTSDHFATEYRITLWPRVFSWRGVTAC
jgi:hypothetical protein